MTGPAEGKIHLKAHVFLQEGGNRIELHDATVYVHLKGYALARVTHLDVEHEALDGLLPLKGGRFLTVRGIKGGLEIKLELTGSKSAQPPTVTVLSPVLNRVLKAGEKTRTWVGGKRDGLYVGFRKAEVEKLEALAQTTQAG